METIADQVGADATLTVHVSYFAICFLHNQSEGYVCSRNIHSLAQRLTPAQDPLNLIWQAQRFKNDIVFSPFMYV